MSQLVQACRANDVTDLVIVHEHRGEPGTVYGHHTARCFLFFLKQNV